MLMSSNTDKETTRGLQFFREANHVLPKNLSGETSQTDDQQRIRPLRVLSDISGFSTIFMPGASSSFVFKTAKSSPHILRLRGGYTRWLSSFDSANTGCEKGFIYVDSQVRLLSWSSLSTLAKKIQNCVRACQLPSQTQFDYPWTLRKVALEEQVDHLAYSTSSETYVFASSQRADFRLPESDDLHPEWRNEGLSLPIANPLYCTLLMQHSELAFCPKIPQSNIKVISPKTWSIIDRY
jgi:cleavage and polyadenylation specificity factor subunit 1